MLTYLKTPVLQVKNIQGEITVHDCFGVEASSIKLLLLEYKAILFHEVFDKDPYQVFNVQSENASKLKRLKQDPK